MSSEAPESVKVVLADPQAVARIGTREVLEAGGIAVVAETGSGGEALHSSCPLPAMSTTTRVFLLLIVLLTTTAVTESVAQQAPDRQDQPSAVLLGGFNLDLSGEKEVGYTRMDPSLDFFITPRWAVGARAVHATSYGQGRGNWSVWSVGPHTSFFPFEGGLAWTLGTTRPYAHGGLAYTHTDRRGTNEINTYQGIGGYAGLGLTHTFFAGVGIFSEATLVGGENYTYGSELLDIRFGISFTP